MQKVMVFGTFDIIHPGHISFLEQAKEYGDYLVVVVGRDITVEQIKGSKPTNNENERLHNVISLKIVDEAVLGKEDDKYQVIEDLKPNVICIGYDQSSFTSELQDEMLKRNVSVKIVKLKPYREEDFKSSKLQNKD
ncbi:adenylyltransferase/cytidyltransferase family protein [Nanoarchaeota archaeon]